MKKDKRLELDGLEYYYTIDNEEDSLRLSSTQVLKYRNHNNCSLAEADRSLRIAALKDYINHGNYKLDTVLFEIIHLLR